MKNKCGLNGRHTWVEVEFTDDVCVARFERPLINQTKLRGKWSNDMWVLRTNNDLLWDQEAGQTRLRQAPVIENGESACGSRI